MPYSTYHTLFAITASRRPSSLIEDLSLLLQLHEYLDTHLIRSSAYHPQTKQVNQIVEDMLRACVLMDGPIWEKHLPLAEFPYNSSYQESIKTTPFEALYGRPCCTPLSWLESGERVIFGPYIVIEAKEKVKQIQTNIIATQSR
jgi:hypothetical protein